MCIRDSPKTPKPQCGCSREVCAANTRIFYKTKHTDSADSIIQMLARKFTLAACSASRFFSGRPFKILGLQQIAIGSLDKAGLQKFWNEVMGLEKVKSFKSEKENVDEDVHVMGKGIAKVELDLMTPLNPDRSPKVHVPPLNHIGLWVDDLNECALYLQTRGIKTVGGIRKGASGHNITFIHPKSACSVLIELVQAPRELIDQFNKL
eukprot:TRINITY_DN5163_c0_g2_i23.p1 TRINITY_DN5163_c0_g2~~TRINITY_DN5163_c0_g2_i23.p1  ORF type:complete len:207 (-),score=64.20 TRINITY_DN5163_c0_g2_i23:68-688(-)